MKKLLNGLLLLFLMATLFSCNNDEPGIDDNKETPPTEIEKLIVGGWNELGNYGITFLKNGYLIYNGKEGQWQYDEISKILTTDVKDNKKNVLSWQINLLQNGSMSGIQLWDGKTFAAQKDIKQALSDILFSRFWSRNKDYKMLVIHFYSRNDYETITYEYNNYNDTFWVGYEDITLTQDNFSVINIRSGENGVYKIHDPFDYDNVWFEFPNGVRYYPINSSMPEIGKIDMTKEELKLVGKWICSEQEWNDGGDISKSLYLEDKYGMEFYDDYWGKMWAGKEQLMEMMNGCQFSWMSKNNNIYVDNDSYKILKLTDSELELEWRDGAYVIKCKFYKYDEKKGLLIDQLEYVDLGLSVKWATKNLGAKSSSFAPEDFYAWGETSPKEKYTLDNYKYCKRLGTLYFWGLTKYCSDPHL